MGCSENIINRHGVKRMCFNYRFLDVLPHLFLQLYFDIIIKIINPNLKKLIVFSCLPIKLTENSPSVNGVGWEINGLVAPEAWEHNRQRIAENNLDCNSPRKELQDRTDLYSNLQEKGFEEKNLHIDVQRVCI